MSRVQEFVDSDYERRFAEFKARRDQAKREMAGQSKTARPKDSLKKSY